MGYTTYFDGSLQFNKPVEEWLVEYINKFSRTRRMKRSPELIKEAFPDGRIHQFVHISTVAEVLVLCCDIPCNDGFEPFAGLFA